MIRNKNGTVRQVRMVAKLFLLVNRRKSEVLNSSERSQTIQIHKRLGKEVKGFVYNNSYEKPGFHLTFSKISTLMRAPVCSGTSRYRYSLLN